MFLLLSLIISHLTLILETNLELLNLYFVMICVSKTEQTYAGIRVLRHPHEIFINDIRSIYQVFKDSKNRDIL